MRVRFWGTRGSFVAPGAAFQRYGGATLCIEVVTDAGARILIDAGTGAIPLGGKLLGDSMRGGSKKFAILLSHTQIDHIQGLPFFAPILMAGWEVTVLGPSHSGRDISGILDAALNPDYSPLYGVENLGPKVVLRTVTEGDFLWEGIRIRTRELPHGRTKSLGFRVEADGVAVAIVSDVEYTGEPPAAVLELASEADLLIHDAMGVAADSPTRVNHARPQDAAHAALDAEAKRLVLYHHDPDLIDDAMDALLYRLREEFPGLTIDAARQGDEIILGLVLYASGQAPHCAAASGSGATVTGESDRVARRYGDASRVIADSSDLEIRP